MMPYPDVDEWIHDLANELIYLAAVYPLGSVVERRGDRISLRTGRHKTSEADVGRVFAPRRPQSARPRQDSNQRGDITRALRYQMSAMRTT